MSGHPTKRDPGLSKAIEAAGGLRVLARGLGLGPGSIAQWYRVPYKQLLDVERLTGIPREKLRPELFRVTATADGSDEQMFGTPEQGRSRG